MIIRNAAYCYNCKTEIESYHAHDYRVCPCGNLSVDGGLTLLKRTFQTTRWEDRSETTEDDKELP